MYFRYIKIAILALIAPIFALVAVIFAVDFFQLVVEILSGNNSVEIGQDIGFYIILIPAITVALGIRQIRRLL